MKSCNSVSAPMSSSLEKGQNGSEIDLSSPAEHSPERRALEKKLVRKIDLRMSILIVIYILNYVSLSSLPSSPQY